MKYPPGEAVEFHLVPLGPNQRAWGHLLGEWIVWALSNWDTVDPCSHCLCKRSSHVVAWPMFCHTHCPIATCYQNKTSCYTTFLFCSYIFVQRDYKNDNLLHLKMHVFQVRHMPWCWEMQFVMGGFSRQTVSCSQRLRFIGCFSRIRSNNREYSLTMIQGTYFNSQRVRLFSNMVYTGLWTSIQYSSAPAVCANCHS